MKIISVVRGEGLKGRVSYTFTTFGPFTCLKSYNNEENTRQLEESFPRKLGILKPSRLEIGNALNMLKAEDSFLGKIESLLSLTHKGEF